MITNLKLKNFGPYESASVDFQDFALILGRNGAGKSLLFNALRAIGRVARHPLRTNKQRGAFSGGYPSRTGQVALDSLIHQGDTARTVMLSATFSSPEINGRYEVHLNKWHNPGGTIVEEHLEVRGPLGAVVRVSCLPDGSVQGSVGVPPSQLRTPRFMSLPILLFNSRSETDRSLASAVQELLWDSVGIYRFDPTALKAPAELDRQLTPTGYNFATYLDGIRNEPNGKEEFEALMTRFREACPHAHDVVLPLEQVVEYDGATRVRKRLSVLMSAGSRQPIPADLESDGTVLLLAYASLLFGPTAKRTICIEEPENGVHPKAIPSLIAMLRDLTTDRGDRRAAQIFVCSHSAKVLDEVYARRNDVMKLVKRGSDGRSVVEAITPDKYPMLHGWAGLV